MALLEARAPTSEPEAHPIPLNQIEARMHLCLDLGDAAAVSAIELALAQAVRHGASDVYFEPHRACTLVRYRIDGTLYDIARLPKSAHDRIVARVKVLAHLPVYQHGTPMDGRIEGDACWGGHGLRVATLPTIDGEKAVMRIVNRDAAPPALARLGFREDMVAALQHLLTRPQGVLFLTGPSSSGKTTTIYALLAEILREQRRTHIVAIEDPVEYRLDGVCQSEVNVESGYDYPDALRAVLRQDPDVIVVGEVRDKSTAQTAIQAGLTGHFVLSTIHSGAAAGVFTRLLDMGIEPYLVASAAIGALAQRLVRRVCPACRTADSPHETLIAQFGLSGEPIDYMRGAGCDSCRGLGYAGRTAIGELIEIDETVADGILARARTRQLHAAACDAGMVSLLHDGIGKVRRGETTLEEVRLVVAPGGEIA